MDGPSVDVVEHPALAHRGRATHRARQPDHPARRGRGTAARLHRRVCLHRTFQAPEFYEHHGYHRFGEIACPPAGATRIFLSKTLA